MASTPWVMTFSACATWFVGVILGRLDEDLVAGRLCGLGEERDVRVEVAERRLLLEHERDLARGAGRAVGGWLRRERAVVLGRDAGDPPSRGARHRARRPPRGWESWTSLPPSRCTRLADPARSLLAGLRPGQGPDRTRPSAGRVVAHGRVRPADDNVVGGWHDAGQMTPLSTAAGRRRRTSALRDVGSVVRTHGASCRPRAATERPLTLRWERTT